MYDSVRAAFVPFSSPLEGVVYWPYVDVKNLVTTAMGYLCDDSGTFHSIPWKVGSGTGPLADSDAVEAGYMAVKGAGAAGRGGGNQAGLSSLRISDDDVANLTATKMLGNEQILKRSFPNYDNLPADAQLLLHSMAWAMGPAFAGGYPSFTSAVNAVTPNWKTAALQSWMKDTTDGWVPKTLDDDYSAHQPNLNPGLRPRNILNRQLAINAYNATQAGTPFSQLWWPSTSGVSTGGAFASAGGFTLAGFLKTLGIAAGVGGAVIGVNMVRTGDSFKATVRKGERFAESTVKRARKLI